MQNTPEILGDVIKAARQRSGITMEELAYKVGVTERYLYRIENENKKPSFYSGSVVKTQIQSFYNELIYIVDKGEGYFPTRLHNQSTVLDSRRTLEFGC